MLDANSGINRANINTLFNGVASNPIGNPIAFNFLINRWSDIESSLGTSYFVNFFRYVCNRLNTQKELDKVSLKLNSQFISVKEFRIRKKLKCLLGMFMIAVKTTR